MASVLGELSDGCRTAFPSAYFPSVPVSGQLRDCPMCAAAAMDQGRWLLLTVGLLTAIPLSEHFEVTSAQNVVGIVGQDTLLPCHISSTKPLDNFEVQWQKITKGHVEEIHIYRHFDGKQTQKDFGWTSMPTDAFATGNVSVTLKNVQPADEGKYRCFVKSMDWSADSVTVLSVAGTSEIFLDILGPQGQGLELACRSYGWFPKPTVQWNAENKQRLSPDTAIDQDSKQVFSVLSRVTVTEEVGDVTCEILNPLLQTEKKANVHFSSAVFPRSSPWLPAFWILLSLLLLTLAASGFLLFRAKQRALKQKSHEEQALLQSDALRSELGALSRQLAFRRARSHMVSITLHVIWKHPELAVSSDWRTVKHKPSAQGPTKSHLPIVVGMEGFASGHHYWEVQVGDGLDWELGVLRETVIHSLKERRWEELPEDGVWSLRRVNGKYCPEEANDKIQSHTTQLLVVGLDLDLEQSKLSFYNIGSSDCILEIFIKGFTKLYPFLRPGLGEAGGSGKPLTINHNTDWDFPQTIQRKWT